ncbi:hypothetical protein EJ110_NYTH41321 [Nymphaea thermarum]|nr:hypothetical protein EJ110_NYTH41321 [Nymphaea thermarum]
MKEAYLAALSVPSLADKFGWCTRDAFYLTVNPVGIWHGIKEFAEGNPEEDAKNLVLGGTHMTARLYLVEECEKFRDYKKGTMLSKYPPAFDPTKTEILIAIGKAFELEQAKKACKNATQAGVTESSAYRSKIEELRLQLNEMCADKIAESESVAENGK